MSEKKSSKSLILYGLMFLAGTAGAYQLGRIWSEKNTPPEQVAAVEAVAPSKTKVPKTINFKLKGGVTSAWDLPEFHLKDIKDETHTLADWKGKLILLNFWATWCPPCRYEIPEFVEYQDKFKDDGLQIIGIGIGDAKSIKNFARTYEMNYPVLITDGSGIMTDWGNEDQVLPYSVLIGRDGKIIYIHRGQLTKLSFKYEIEPHIKETLTASK